MSLDQFYTKPEIAKKCVESIDLTKYTKILEPSAGNGSFFNLIPGCIGIDLEPAANNIIEMNFYDWKDKVDLVIGNPPFGRVSSEAVKFFNHAAKIADTIAFIIPRTFRRVSVQNRLNLNFHLVSDTEIPMGSFIPSSMQAKCCFQVWERKDTKRNKVELPLVHKDFTILHLDNRFKADFALRAYGSNCGQISFDIENLAKKSWHFIHSDDDTIIDIFENLSYYPLAADTARQDSIGKAELILLYTNYKKGISNVN